MKVYSGYCSATAISFYKTVGLGNAGRLFLRAMCFAIWASKEFHEFAPVGKPKTAKYKTISTKIFLFVSSALSSHQTGFHQLSINAANHKNPIAATMMSTSSFSCILNYCFIGWCGHFAINFMLSISLMVPIPFNTAPAIFHHLVSVHNANSQTQSLHYHQSTVSSMEQLFYQQFCWQIDSLVNLIVQG